MTEPATPASDTLNWDQFVAEASRPPITINLPAGDTATATMPLGKQIKMINEAMSGVRSPDALLDELFGPDDADKLRALADEHPILALGLLVDEVMKKFGLSAPILTALSLVRGGKGLTAPASSTPASST